MTATATHPIPTPVAPAGRQGRAAPSAWPRIAAGIHHQSGSLKVVVTRQDAPDAHPAVVESLTIPASDSAALASLLAKHKVTDAVRLISSAGAVARCTPVPSGISSDRQQAAAALALVAESEMPSMIPAHRRAAGIIHPGLDPHVESVLVVGWSERDTPSGPDLPVKQLTWTPELVALAALARALGGVELALYADRHAGSVALIAIGKSQPHAGSNGSSPANTKTVARVLRGDAASDDSWIASLRRSITETAAFIGRPPPHVNLPDSASTTLLLLGSPLRPPRGVPSDPNWLTNYGIAYGAVAALADPDPAARPLALLRSTAPRENGNVLVRAVEYLATPRRAAIAAVICFAVFLLWPLGVAKSRELILANRAGGVDVLNQRLKNTERRVAFYQHLREKRWPMIKLVADIAGAAPVGVHIDSLSLSREQGVNIRGRAQKTDQVTDLRTNLAASGIFGSVGTPNVETDADAITFQLEAQVVAPQYAGKRAGDFVATPLAVHLYGERARTSGTGTASTGAATPTTPSVAPSSDDAPSRATRSTGSGRSGLRDAPRAASDDDSGGTRRPAGGASSIPEPLTDAAIAAMDAKTAMGEWASRKKASTVADLDPAVKQRLVEEAEKCRARMVEARGG